MQRLFLALVACVSGAAFAASSPNQVDLQGYYSTLHQRNMLADSLATVPYPATDLTITNASNSIIISTVPGSPIYDTNAAETNDHIRHDTLVAPTHIRLLDPYGNAFFDQFVCRLAVVTVYGGVGSYRVNVDGEYCNRP